MLKAILGYRQFIYSCVRREFQTKYQQSLLGSLWAVLNPLAMIIVYTVIFSQIMRAKLPGIDSSFAYSIYLCAGTIAWGLFSEMLVRCTSIFIDNANMLKKINFPRVCLPIIVSLSAFVNFLIIFSLFLIFLLIIDYFPGWTIVGVIPLLLVQIMFAAGLGILLGVINVFFRDVGQFLGVFMQFWFWFTPIVYPINIIPENLRGLLVINPMYHIIKGYQDIFMRNVCPDWSGIFIVGLLAVGVCMFAIRLYHRHIGEVVDEL